jgi:hypothetical protein
MWVRYFVLALAILLSVLTAFASVVLVVARVPLSLSQTAIYFVPTSYPLAIVGFHDVDAMQFQFRIVLGWPDGLTLLAPRLQDDQSEFMRVQRISHGTILGFMTFVASLTMVVILELLNFIWPYYSSPQKLKQGMKPWAWFE